MTESYYKDGSDDLPLSKKRGGVTYIQEEKHERR